MTMFDFYVRLKRLTALEREEKKKQEKRDRKEENQDDLRPMTFVKYTKPPKHQVS